MNTRKTFIAAATAVAVTATSITAAGAAEPVGSLPSKEDITGSLHDIFEKPVELEPIGEDPELPADEEPAPADPAPEEPAGSDIPKPDLAGSDAGSIIGLLAIIGTLGAAGWAAFEWLKRNPQQLTVRF